MHTSSPRLQIKRQWIHLAGLTEEPRNVHSGDQPTGSAAPGPPQRLEFTCATVAVGADKTPGPDLAQDCSMIPALLAGSPLEQAADRKARWPLESPAGVFSGLGAGASVSSRLSLQCSLGQLALLEGPSPLLRARRDRPSVAGVHPNMVWECALASNEATTVL